MTAPKEEDHFVENVATFGDRLTAARVSSGYTVEVLAQKLAVDVEKIENWESDRDAPRANRIPTLAGLLNVSVVWLVSGESNGTTYIQESYQRPVIINEALSVISDLKATLDAAMDRIEDLEERLKAEQD